MGVPIAIKEIFCVHGFPFEAGSDIDISNLVPAEGPFVAALKQQGCVILGITKTTEFTAATINSSKRMPWNRWDASEKRVCGGLSHGFRQHARGRHVRLRDRLGQRRLGSSACRTVRLGRL